MNIDNIKIIDLDKQITLNEVNDILSRYDICLNDTEKGIYRKLKNSQIMSTKCFEFIFKLAMREIIWCKITDCSFHVSIEFGYDFYTYLVGLKLENSLIEKYKSLGLFIELLEG